MIKKKHAILTFASLSGLIMTGCSTTDLEFLNSYANAVSQAYVNEYAIQNGVSPTTQPSYNESRAVDGPGTFQAPSTIKSNVRSDTTSETPYRCGNGTYKSSAKLCDWDSSEIKFPD